MLTTDRTTTTPYTPTSDADPAAGRDLRDQPLNLRTILVIVALVSPFVTAAIAWTSAVERLDGKLDQGRFVADSIRRDRDREWDRNILLRLDRRTQAMYCSGKPPGCE